MVNPGSFSGVRLAFLMEQKLAYTTAVLNDEVPECLVDIYYRYFKQFPVEASHDVDPSPEELAAVNDDDADPEYPLPDPDQLPAEEFKKAKETYTERQCLVRFRKGVCTHICHHRRTCFVDFGLDSKFNVGCLTNITKTTASTTR